MSPRKVYVMVPSDVIQGSVSVLHALGRITSMVPPHGAQEYWKVDIENRDWPPGDYAQAAVHIMKTMVSAVHVQLTAQITLP